MPRTREPEVRKADHAGSWYSSNSSTLRGELQNYWDDALPKLQKVAQPPFRHARAIISPHAGFRFSGPTAGVAYRALDIQPGTKNIFVIGPSHHIYITMGTVSTCDQIETPLGNLEVNREICDELSKEPSLYSTVSKSDEEAEHSLEMQYPWLKFAIDKALDGPSFESQPSVVPIMVGNTSPAMEKQLGKSLAPYLKDPTNLFVVSSDFAHWGKRFRYTYYLPDDVPDQAAGLKLQSDSQVRSNDSIHASISRVDHLSMDAIATGTYEVFKKVLDDTGNTVCGRHPIGIMMCALNVLHKDFELSENLSRFVFTDYTRSGLVDDVEDSSVSYASAFAKVECMNVLALIKRHRQLEKEAELTIDAQNWQGSESAATISDLSEDSGFGKDYASSVSELESDQKRPPASPLQSNPMPRVPKRTAQYNFGDNKHHGRYSRPRGGVRSSFIDSGGTHSSSPPRAQATFVNAINAGSTVNIQNVDDDTKAKSESRSTSQHTRGRRGRRSGRNGYRGVR